MRLGVNIDHVATVRQARKTYEPEPLKAALIAERAGADQITVHLRADRRHIQDQDVRIIKANLSIPLNIELSVKKEMREIASRLRPHKVTLVPERRTEITTEGGLDVVSKKNAVKKFIKEVSPRNIQVAAFIDPEIDQIDACLELGINEVEFNTGVYADAKNEEIALKEASRLEKAAKYASNKNMIVAAGHGLTTKNLQPILRIKEIEELNIGHHIIAEAVFVGLDNKIKQMLELIN